MFYKDDFSHLNLSAALRKLVAVLSSVIASATVTDRAFADSKTTPNGYVRCATADISPSQMHKVEAGLKVSALLSSFAKESNGKVPEVTVYFHIIQNNAGENTVTSDQISQQINVLNAAYRGEIAFLLGGIDLVVNDDWFTGVAPGSFKEYEMKNALHLGASQALNIYLTVPGEFSGSTVLGYASFPWEYSTDPVNDGIVILFATLPGGNAAPYNQGDTITHEVGHWLGLYHTFQAGSSRGNGCSGKGDFVSDTPAEKQPHLRCKLTDSCRHQNGKDPIHNYMNYTPDACLNTFSEGQFKRIRAVWRQFRSH